MRGIKSPLNLSQVQRDVALMKATNELVRMHGVFIQKAENMLQLALLVRNEAERVKNLPQGNKGDRGEIGPRGVPGKDGSNGTNGKDGVNGLDGVSPDIQAVALKVLSMIKTPQDGKDAVLDEDKIVEKMIDKLFEGKKFDWRKIPGLANEMASYRNQLARIDHAGPKLAGKRYGIDTWARGGGSGGGSSGTDVFGEVVAGSATTWTLANAPTNGTLRVYANGQRLYATTDYSISGATITTVQSWVAGSILADYSYA